MIPPAPSGSVGLHDRFDRLGVSQRDMRNPAENVYPHSMQKNANGSMV